MKQVHLHQHVTMAHNKPTKKQQSDVKSMLTDDFLGEPIFCYCSMECSAVCEQSNCTITKTVAYMYRRLNGTNTQQRSSTTKTYAMEFPSVFHPLKGVKITSATYIHLLE